VSAPLPDLILYGRAGCHLCEDARATLDLLLTDREARGLPVPAIVERDIDADEEWHRRYAFTIPVVVLGSHELELATSPAALRRLLEDVLDGAPAR
jgi:glutaredoxin